MQKDMCQIVLSVVLALIALVRMHGWTDEGRIRATTATVDAARITQADREPGNWLTHGRTYAEQRYSTLHQIHADNVRHLGLAWFHDTHTSRGLEGTPLAVDGVLYATGPWSVVYAIDGRTGKRLWEYDPQVPRHWAKYACCDVVNRGAALWQGKVYVGTIDGRLVALDAATGQVVWDTLTIDPGKPYTITGAPRIVKGKVIIGNGGAEFGVRGYVSAYDADTGALLWRFYTVPGDPSQPFENAAMVLAASTWHGRQWWIVGGGGNGVGLVGVRPRA
jgi:quinohemoprotein ethanol dehydrogenase